MEKDEAIRLTLDGLRTRVNAHYVSLSDEDLTHLRQVMDDVLTPYVSDAMVENRQYNPKTDQVEEI
jgi:hypothetical protein